MRLVIAIMMSLLVLTSVGEAKQKNVLKRILWTDASGSTVYEGLYRLTKYKGKPALVLVKSYRYGPFNYRCMAPETIDHGHVKINNYLRQPSICHVPAGYKVCLQRAFVQHGPINVLPYLYVESLFKPCKTEVVNLRAKPPVFYRPAPLIPIAHH